MANEYIDRIKAGIDRGPATPEAFRAGFSDYEAALTPDFVSTAQSFSETGEADIILALGELSSRVRILSDGLIPGSRPDQIDFLLDHFGLSIDGVRASLQSRDVISDMDRLRGCIVRAPENIRGVMKSQHLLSHEVLRQLNELDRNSAYYNPAKREIRS